MNGVFLIINYEDMKIESFGEKTNEITKQVIQLEQKGFIKQGEIQSVMFDGTNMGFQQAMIKKASE